MLYSPSTVLGKAHKVSLDVWNATIDLFCEFNGIFGHRDMAQEVADREQKGEVVPYNLFARGIAKTSK